MQTCRKIIFCSLELVHKKVCILQSCDCHPLATAACNVTAWVTVGNGCLTAKVETAAPIRFGAESVVSACRGAALCSLKLGHFLCVQVVHFNIVRRCATETAVALGPRIVVFQTIFHHGCIRFIHNLVQLAAQGDVAGSNGHAQVRASQTLLIKLCTMSNAKARRICGVQDLSSRVVQVASIVRLVLGLSTVNKVFFPSLFFVSFSCLLSQRLDYLHHFKSTP